MTFFGMRVAVLVLILTPAALGYDAQSDGTDGALNPAPGSGTVTINLAQAATGAWNAPIAPSGMGKGIYDPTQWAVVFKYTSINIPAGVTVVFQNHPKGAPVVWLVQGSVTIAGTVDLRGTAGGFNNFRAQGGPGGFAGGVRVTNSPDASAGEGPGGGQKGCGGGNGGYGEVGGGGSGGVIYGSPTLLPLIGGSGGGGATGPCSSPAGGGGGGGAILIVASSGITIDQTGVINADGGAAGNAAGHGSGGGIRLIADSIGGTGLLYARSGDTSQNFGWGRIRIETLPNQNSILDPQCKPMPSRSVIQGTIFPANNAPANAPSLRIVNISSTLPSADPFGNLNWSEDMLISKTTTQATIRIEAKNVTLPANTTVQIRIVPAYGSAPQPVPSSPLLFDSGTGAYYSDTNLLIPSGRSVIQLRLPMP